MLVVVSGLFIMMGIVMLTYELIVPVTVAEYGTVIQIHMMGVIFLILGLFIIFIRLKQTGVGGLLDMPQEDRIKCFYQPGYSSNTKILKGQLMDDNLIKAEGKLINYKGGGFRIAGHECIRVHGNVVSNIPEWLGETLARYKAKYGVDDIYKLRALYKRLRDLNENDELLKQLKTIPELARVLDKPEKLKDITNMAVKDVKNMAETLWDGTTYCLEPDIDEFIQTATPAQVHQYAMREYMSKRSRDRVMRSSGGGGDLMKYAMPVGILLFLAALGAGIFMQMSG